ncbi:hypothetical protein TNIN_189731 [Trichonephila inaurata madagascariensis]|uniref:Uncharacterized protein n=1 Tax=Trichonephila inaurata madagascariensis TaxID=2747483 RepID=A0A8X6YG45_9ARAC|nr:hypothetical protein TNIN_189731 [Trichonephila inaurata madagascariensis]
MGQLGNKRIRVDIRCISCKAHLSSSAKFTRRQLNIPDKKQPKEFDWISESFRLLDVTEQLDRKTIFHSISEQFFGA